MPTSTDRVLGGSNQYNAVFTDKKDNATMDQMDFIKLMVAQMQNQDFTNPMDNTQMVTQMAQFSNMQMMQEMASYAKTNYAMSLVGKTVTASRFNVSGTLDTTTGTVQKVSLVDDEYVLYVGGKKYTLAQVMSIQSGGGAAEEQSPIDPQNYSLSASEIKADSATVTWQVPTEDELTAAGLRYTVYYSQEEGFDTVEAVEQGTLVGAKEQKGVTSVSLTDLQPHTRYYVNVVVTDENGLKSVYRPIVVDTRF